jgi:hypothetical protein
MSTAVALKAMTRDSRRLRSEGWIRSRSQEMGLRILGIAAVLFATPPTIVSAVGHLPDEPPMPLIVRLLILVCFVGLGAVGIFSILRFSRCGCRIEPAGLAVLNPFSERLYPWESIDHFSIGRHGLFPYICRIHLRDGSLQTVWGIQAPNLAPQNRRTQGLVDQLEGALVQRRTSITPSS